MPHPTEGTLRRLLDEPAGVADPDRAHAEACGDCRIHLATMREDAELVRAALDDDVEDAAPAPAPPVAAPAPAPAAEERGSFVDDLLEVAGDFVSDVADAVVVEEQRRHVRTALGRLPRTQAVALVLRHNGFSYAEVAAALDLSPGSVGTTPVSYTHLTLPTIYSV